MGRKHHSPSYLIWQNSGYCFRLIVPVDLRPIVGIRELRYSLRTGFLGAAKNRARSMAEFAQRIFKYMRKGGQVRELKDVEIQDLLRNYFRETLEQDELDRVTGIPLDDQVHDELMTNYAYLKDTLQRQLSLCDYEHISKIVKKFILEPKEITVNEDSIPFKKMCREALKLELKKIEISEKRETGDYDSEAELMSTSSALLPPTLPTSEQTSEPVSKIIEKYAQEYQKAGRWTPKTTEETLTSLKLFIDIVGDVPVHTIDHKVMRHFKDTLILLPPNQNKVRKYRDKSVAEILKMDIEKTLSVSSIKKIHGRVSSLFTWAVNNGYMERNCAEKMQIKQTKRPDEFREQFTQDDLKLLFHSKMYMEDSHDRSYKFWMPILGLFTGARIDELAQLHLSDIRHESGVWVFDINRDAPDKKLKNKSSKRLTPIHPLLTNDLKLVQYAEKLKAEGHTRLFPELKRSRDGYGYLVSKWFVRYAKECGATGEKKSFHSFRHTFANVLKQDYDVQNAMVSEVLGHADTSMTTGRYAERYAPSVLLDKVIKMLRFDVDLGHLERSRFVSS